MINTIVHNLIIDPWCLQEQNLSVILYSIHLCTKIFHTLDDRLYGDIKACVSWHLTNDSLYQCIYTMHKLIEQLNIWFSNYASYARLANKTSQINRNFSEPNASDI